MSEVEGHEVRHEQPPRRPNGYKRIDKMYAYIIRLPGDDTEGVPAYMDTEGRWTPLVGADIERMMLLRNIARNLALQAGAPISLVEFSERREIEVLDG